MGSTQTYGFTDVGPVFVLASRLVPDLDGGFGRAVLMRARDLAATGTDVTMLTVDPATRAVHDEHRAEFRRRGEILDGMDLRNLFDDAVADPTWLRAAAHDGDAVLVALPALARSHPRAADASSAVDEARELSTHGDAFGAMADPEAGVIGAADCAGGAEA